MTPATTDRACTSSPTQLPSLITGASRKLRLYRRATPDGNPRQLTSEAPALHTVWPTRAAAPFIQKATSESGDRRWTMRLVLVRCHRLLLPAGRSRVAKSLSNPERRSRPEALLVRREK